jgi:peroxiredoxin
MRKTIPTPWFIAAILASVVAALWVLGKATPTTTSAFGGSGAALVGKPAPAFEGATISGETFRSADWRGKVLLVNFWATWCGPCRMEIPDLVALHERYRARGFAVVGLSTDEQGMAVVRPFAAENRINYPVLLTPPGLNAAFGGVPALPATFLVDRRGTIVFAHEGLASADLLIPEIEKAL